MGTKVTKHNNRGQQLAFRQIRGWGGNRTGAGRINRSGQVNHMKREKVTGRTPLHITLRLKKNLPTLRRKALLTEFARVFRRCRDFGLNVIHFSVQTNHVHLIAEARSNRTLALGMRSLAGGFAKRYLGKVSGVPQRYPGKVSGVPHANGGVFDGRYHLRLLNTPTEVKNALRYVLLNLSKHQNRIEYIDDFSSAPLFHEWKKLIGAKFRDLIAYDAAFWKKKSESESEILRNWQEALSAPESWLMKIGWMKVT